MKLPEHVREYLDSKGIRELFPPQREAVEKGLFDDKNLLIASPTASGKTLLAEMRALHEIIESHGEARVVYVVPFRALAREKYEELKDVIEFCREKGVESTVEISTGDIRRPIRELRPGITVTTAEKLDASLRSRPSLVEDVDLLVLDEVHIVGDRNRGATYEALISLVRTFRKEVSLLALSATVGNAEELADWLDATPVISDWRPVKLEHVIVEVPSTSEKDAKVRDLIRKCLREGGQALVFLYSRRRTMTEAKNLSRMVSGLLSDDEKKELRTLAERVSELGEGEETEILTYSVMRGVAFHHAGLTAEQRALVEDAFREGLLKVVVSTPTLAAGVNLPARYVIIKDFGIRLGNEIKPTKNEFKQMAGRAGRPGYDDIGLVFVLTTPNLKELAEEYVHSDADPIRSRIWASGPQLRRFLLGLVAAGFCRQIADVMQVALNTFASSVNIRPEDAVLSSLKMLVDWEFLEEMEGELTATRVGHAVSQSYLTPDSAKFLLRCMEEVGTEEDVVLPSITLCPDFQPAPISPKSRDMSTLDEFMGGSPSVEADEVLELAVEEFGYDDWELERRLAWAEALSDWVSGSPDRSILRKYGLYPGDLYRAKDDAAWIAWGMSRLANAAGITWRSPLLSRRLEYGVPKEALELTEVEGVGRTLAMRLYRAGYHSVRDLAEATVTELMRVKGIGERLARKILKNARRLTGT
ncbi:DEAD/DEAH box helicase [Methanopyrus sp. SNP6]|uniref:DEAD/DEAH box helicase n=1 Tax=Methanopyrus sp. SNP6 TaxID=1937005 RepID=UPI00143C1584|nr:DEAD/DEAH box helicase [Methanopyrus sp. SNP6]